MLQVGASVAEEEWQEMGLRGPCNEKSNEPHQKFRNYPMGLGESVKGFRQG